VQLKRDWRRRLVLHPLQRTPACRFEIHLCRFWQRPQSGFNALYAVLLGGMSRASRR